MDIVLPNADEVYAHYLVHQQSVLRARMMYGLLALRIRPRVRYVGDAEAELNGIMSSRSVPLLIAANHVRESDPLVLAAAGFFSPIRKRVGHLRVLAKDELFQESRQRAKIDALGGIPVFRPKDHAMRAAVAAGRQMIDVCAERMARGDSVAVFPEGTCNPGAPEILQKIGSGVGHIGTQARKLGSVNPQLVCIAIAYPDPKSTSRRPLVLIDEPHPLDAVSTPTAAAVTRLVANNLQRVVSHAYD